jgi:hypothetical protein
MRSGSSPLRAPETHQWVHPNACGRLPLVAYSLACSPSAVKDGVEASLSPGCSNSSAAIRDGTTKLPSNDTWPTIFSVTGTERLPVAAIGYSVVCVIGRGSTVCRGSLGSFSRNKVDASVAEKPQPSTILLIRKLRQAVATTPNKAKHLGSWEVCCLLRLLGRAAKFAARLGLIAANAPGRFNVHWCRISAAHPFLLTPLDREAILLLAPAWRHASDQRALRNFLVEILPDLL